MRLPIQIQLLARAQHKRIHIRAPNFINVISVHRNTPWIVFHSVQLPLLIPFTFLGLEFAKIVENLLVKLSRVKSSRCCMSRLQKQWDTNKTKSHEKITGTGVTFTVTTLIIICAVPVKWAAGPVRICIPFLRTCHSDKYVRISDKLRGPRDTWLPFD